jgi:predicted porin
LEKFEMKKSLIALAVLAASGASMAQSTVTLYGIADLWFGTVSTETAGVSLSQTMLESGGVNGSRWGMKGSEDLGGGLKANFDLQAGFSMDTGAVAAPAVAPGVAAGASFAFSRQSWVGFSGGFGGVRLGRTTTPFDDVSGSSNAMFDSGALSPAGSGVFKSTGYSARQNNMLYYQAPTMSGFSGAISYALGEDKTAATSATSTTSLNLTYGAGPLAVQFAYQVQDVVNATAASSDAAFTRLGASYNFGVATAKATYGKVSNVGSATDVNATEYQIGVDFPMSSALTLSASYAKSNDDQPVAGAFEQARQGFGVGAAYTLSKRTFVYGGYRSNTATVLNTTDTKSNALAVGVQHRF